METEEEGGGGGGDGMGRGGKVRGGAGKKGDEQTGGLFAGKKRNIFHCAKKKREKNPTAFMFQSAFQEVEIAPIINDLAGGNFLCMRYHRNKKTRTA